MSISQLDAFRGGDKLVRIVGHRGARGHMPENTLEGFDWTLSMGIEALEFDVLLTKDDVPVIVHNHHLTASTTRDQNGKWLPVEPVISQLTFEEISTYDVGGIDSNSEYGKRFPDQMYLSNIKVPRLTDLLNLITQPRFSRAVLMLEIKSDPNAKDPESTRKKTVEKVVQNVRNTGLSHRTILHSFDWEILKECQRIAPDIPTSFLTQLPENDDDVGEDSSSNFGQHLQESASIPDLVAQAGGQLWCPYIKDLAAKDIERAHQLGLLVVTWTANDINDIANAIDLGVDGIVSDYPGRVQHALLSRGYGWLPKSLENREEFPRFPGAAAL